MTVVSLTEYRACNYPERPFGCTEREIRAFNRASYQAMLHERRQLTGPEIAAVRLAARENRPVSPILWQAG